MQSESSSMVNNEFSLESYRQLLLAFKSMGYRFCKFLEASPADAIGPYVIIRHDVDFSVRGALQIAKIESREGVGSTFFFQLRSPLYNALGQHSSNVIRTIYDQGHDIALHVDLSLYGDRYMEGLREEIRLLSTYYPFANTEIVSFHRPGDIEKLQRMQLLKVRHTYERRFFGDMIYISDSKGVWRYGNPTTSRAFHSRKPIQLVIHPMWWTEKGETPLEKFDSFISGNRAETIELLRQVVSFPVDL
jgi:hypothetical protein